MLDLKEEYILKNISLIENSLENDPFLKKNFFLWCAANGKLKVIKYLIEQAKDYNIDKNLALRLSEKNGYMDVVNFLLKKGAKSKKN